MMRAGRKDNGFITKTIKSLIIFIHPLCKKHFSGQNHTLLTYSRYKICFIILPSNHKIKSSVLSEPPQAF